MILMSLLIAAFPAACTSPVPPQEPQWQIEELISGLRSDDLAERDRADHSLRASRTSSLPVLKKRLAACENADERARLQGIVAHLLKRRSDELYADAKGAEALLVLAEAEGAADAPQFVREKTSGIRAYFDAVFEASKEPHAHQGWNEVVRKFQGMGRWAIIALVEVLGDNEESASLAVRILSELHPCDVLVLARAALAHQKPQVQRRACQLLGNLKMDEALESLQKLYNKPVVAGDVKKAAREAYIKIARRPPEDKASK